MNRIFQYSTFFALFFTYTFSAFAQKINCDGKVLNISNFKADSVATFENRYVSSQAVSSIKLSKYPLEIRIYTLGWSIDHVSLKILQSDGKTSIFSQCEIIVGNAAARENYEVFYRNGNPVGRIKKKIRNVKISCKQIMDLKKCQLFSMKSSNQSEFKDKNDGTYYYDAGGIYIFEIKVNDKFRNFQYTIDPNSRDTIAGRSKNINSIIQMFSKFK